MSDIDDQIAKRLAEISDMPTKNIMLQYSNISKEIKDIKRELHLSIV